MSCNIKRDLEQIKAYLNIDEFSKPIDILFDIFKIDTIGVDNNWFFECIHETNNLLEHKANQFLESLLSNSCPFSLVHGYSKNGKSTFLEYVRYINNQKSDSSRLVIDKLNFEKGSANDYIDKVRLFWLDELCVHSNFQNCIDEFTLFYEFYNDFVLDLKEFISKKDGGISQKNSKLTSYFENFCEYDFYELNLFLKKKVNEINSGADRIKIKESIKGKLKRVIKVTNCGDFLSLLLLFRIFKYRYKFFYDKSKHQKLIFLLDNMDDYLKENDLLFYQYPQIQLSTFIYHFTKRPFISRTFSDSLKKYINASDDKIASWSFSFSRSLNITYVFRTSNFLAFSNIINEAKNITSQSREKFYPECMLDINYYRVNSINYSDDILKKRLDFAKNLFFELKLDAPKGFVFLEILSKLDKHHKRYYTSVEDELETSKSIFSLWNGDKKAFIDNLSYNKNKLPNLFFKYEDIISNCYSSPFKNSSYLLKGVYIYLFLFLLSNSRSLNNFLKTIYKYRKTHKIGKSIRRFLLNYVINNSEGKFKPSTLAEIEDKGVGLLDLLTEIDNFIYYINTKSKKELYSFSNVEDFFKDIYTDKIDYFAQFFSIYKSQIVDIDGTKANTIYYNLDKELKIFKDKTDKKALQDLDKIRVFNNHNSAFLAASLITHFELFSFALSHEENNKSLSIQKPLLFTARKKINVQMISAKEDFEFYEIINKVYENAKAITESIVNFYTNYLIDKYPPEEFIESKLLTLFNKKKGIGDFKFRLIIRRHINYIEGFRVGVIIKETITKLEPYEKQIANEYLIDMIIKYINHYNDLYGNIKKRLKDKLIQPETILDIDFRILQKYKKRAMKALAENKKGIFKTIIEFN